MQASFSKWKGSTRYGKGAYNIIKRSERHIRLDFNNYSTGGDKITPIGNVLVHQNCRQDFLNPRKVPPRS